MPVFEPQYCFLPNKEDCHSLALCGECSLPWILFHQPLTKSFLKHLFLNIITCYLYCTIFHLNGFSTSVEDPMKSEAHRRIAHNITADPHRFIPCHTIYQHLIWSTVRNIQKKLIFIPKSYLILINKHGKINFEKLRFKYLQKVSI